MILQFIHLIIFLFYGDIQKMKKPRCSTLVLMMLAISSIAQAEVIYPDVLQDGKCVHEDQALTAYQLVQKAYDNATGTAGSYMLSGFLKGARSYARQVLDNTSISDDPNCLAEVNLLREYAYGAKIGRDIARADQSIQIQSDLAESSRRLTEALMPPR